MVKRIKNDYEASRRQEKLLSGPMTRQSQRVGAEASKTAQYNALKREVDMQHQMYQTLLVQQRRSEPEQLGAGESDPHRGAKLRRPKPLTSQVPVLNISLGTLLGLVLAGGFVFLSERMDRSIKEPGMSRRMFNAPELGVIPNLAPT